MKTKEKSWQWVGNAVDFLKEERLCTGIAETEGGGGVRERE